MFGEERNLKVTIYSEVTTLNLVEDYVNFFTKLVSLIPRNLEIIFELKSTANYILKFNHLFKPHSYVDIVVIFYNKVV
jgi:hypothetical protein